MDQPSIITALADLNLPAVRYFDHLDSTNDEARRWIETGAPDRSLVVADEQTAGRGRQGRRWVSPHGAGLAFSLILRSPPLNLHYLSRLAGLGAMAVCNALVKLYTLPSQVKWPNDVLIGGQKAAGVLVEARWSGQHLEAATIGIGINIAPHSISAANLLGAELNFPATCVESAVGHPVNRLELLHAVLSEALDLLPHLPEPAFILDWEAHLAYFGQWVEVSSAAPGAGTEQSAPGMSGINLVGKVAGLAQDGSLKLVTQAGAEVELAIGEVHLRPALAETAHRPQE